MKLISKLQGAILCHTAVPCCQQGLHSTEGQLFTRSIGLRKLLRPKLILIEQVAGFHSHPHRMWIEKALWFAGCQLRFSRVIELGDAMPVRRSRWLGIAYFIHGDDIQMSAISSWSVECTLTLLELDCIRSWPEEVIGKLLAPEHALQRARNYPLHRSAKHQRRCTRNPTFSDPPVAACRPLWPNMAINII